MKNKLALVTGGTGGIGTAICKALFKQKAHVIATYNRGGRHQEALEWQEKLKQAGFNFSVEYVDVTDFDSCATLATNVLQKYGTPDILINNAGVTQDIQCAKMDLAAWQKVINTNLNGTFHMIRHFLNPMIEKGYGRIINISSINGQKGQFGQVNYAASKAGIHGFTKSLALEVARKGITVNTISPGYVATDMVMAVPEKIRDQILTQIPVGRFGKPAEIARAVQFLASQKSGFITGSNLTINGGQYLT